MSTKRAAKLVRREKRKAKERNRGRRSPKRRAGWGLMPPRPVVEPRRPILIAAPPVHDSAPVHTVDDPLVIVAREPKPEPPPPTRSGLRAMALIAAMAGMRPQMAHEGPPRRRKP